MTKEPSFKVGDLVRATMWRMTGASLRLQVEGEVTLVLDNGHVLVLAKKASTYLGTVLFFSLIGKEISFPPHEVELLRRPKPRE